MHFANALVWEIIGPAMAGPTGPCATPVVKVASSHHLYVSSLPLLNFGKNADPVTLEAAEAYHVS